MRMLLEEILDSIAMPRQTRLDMLTSMCFATSSFDGTFENYVTYGTADMKSDLRTIASIMSIVLGI